MEENTKPFARTELLLGKPAMERLSGCRVAVFGIGVVGGYVCEALVRSGPGQHGICAVGCGVDNCGRGS